MSVNAKIIFLVGVFFFYCSITRILLKVKVYLTFSASINQMSVLQTFYFIDIKNLEGKWNSSGTWTGRPLNCPFQQCFMFDFKQSFRLSFIWMKMISETKRSVGHETFLPKWFMILKVAALAGNDWRRESQSVRRGRMWWCEEASCQWPPPGPWALTISYHVWVPPMSRRPSYYWQFLPVAVRLITLYFCQSSVTSMINVEFYVTQADKWSKGLMFTSFGRTLTNGMTHVMSKISRELLDFVSLEQGKYQNTRETCCWVESQAGDVLLLFPVPF